MPERKIKIGKKATIDDLLKFIHQAMQLEFNVLSIEIKGDNVYLVIDVREEDRGRLKDFIKGKIYYQVMQSFRAIK